MTCVDVLKSLKKGSKKREKVERLGHVTCVDQSQASIQYSENFQRCINGENLWKSIQKKRSRDLCWPIRGQYYGHVTCINQSETSIQVLRSRDLYWSIRGQSSSIKITWPVLTNQRPVFRSRDLCWPIRGQYSSIKVTWPVLTNQRPVFNLVKIFKNLWKSIQKKRKGGKVRLG